MPRFHIFKGDPLPLYIVPDQVILGISMLSAFMVFRGGGGGGGGVWLGSRQQCCPI